MSTQSLRIVDRNHVLYQGRKLLFFGGTDYHRLSSNPSVIRALAEAAAEYGISAGGSRTTTGTHPLHLKLEEKLAGFFGTEAAVVFASGYLSNTILLQAIAPDFDVFLLDEAAHSSLKDAAGLFDKKLIYFKHVDAGNLQEQFIRNVKAGERALILTDGVFPAMGEMPPLDAYAHIARKFGARILLDDAHAMAVLGKTGKGSWEAAGIDRELMYQTGTLSKGFGVFGGVIPATRSLVEKIHRESEAFIGSTGLALPLVAAAIQSVAYLQTNPLLIRELQDRALELKEKFRRLGFIIPHSQAPIISIIFSDERKNKQLYRMLLENGIYPPFINYPGSPPGGHFRFVISSQHSEEQVELLFETVRTLL